MGETTQDADLKTQIRDHYAERAVAAGQAQPCGCGCSCGPAAVEPLDDVARGLYSVDETSELPAEAVLASLGCGNPTALAELQPGEVVLDLGSGGGIDVLLSRPPRRPHRQGLRHRHDRRDARAGAREPAQGRRRERRVPQGRARGHPAARRLGRRDHQQLRRQPLHRQGPRPGRGLPRAQARRPLRHQRRALPGRHERRARVRFSTTPTPGPRASPGRSRSGTSSRACSAPASSTRASR